MLADDLCAIRNPINVLLLPTIPVLLGRILADVYCLRGSIEGNLSFITAFFKPN